MKLIAVVEDNPDNRLLVRVILESLYRVDEYDNGLAALDGMRLHKPDLVLLDVSLPGMDGAEVLNKIRTDPQLRELPVIALTAHAMRGDREKFLAAGFNDYITKPIVDEALLLNAMENLLTSCPPGNQAAPVSAPAAAAGSQIDVAALDRMQHLGGAVFVVQMIDLFLDYAGAKIREALLAQAAGDLDRVQAAVHPIRSSAGNVGATRIQQLATRIEDLARERQTAPVAAALEELEKAFDAAKPELHEKRKALSP